MSDTTYNARQYIRFEVGEFIAMIITALFASLSLNVRELLFTKFGDASGIQSTVVMFIFILFVMMIAVYLCKIVAIKVGTVITYQAHTIGLVITLIITIMSAGWLPLFLPGGFLFDDPRRLRVGKWVGSWRRGWETGLITGSFPLAVLLFVLIFSPLYLYSVSDLYAKMLIACCLLALYSLIPLPFFTSRKGSKDWWTHLKDCTFGLDVLYSSRFWYGVLTVMVLLFSLSTLLLTVVGVRTGIVIYALSLILAFAGMYVYSKFFNHS